MLVTHHHHQKVILEKNVMSTYQDHHWYNWYNNLSVQGATYVVVENDLVGWYTSTTLHPYLHPSTSVSAFNFAVTPIPSLCLPHLFKGASGGKETPKKSTYIESKGYGFIFRGHLCTLASCCIDLHCMWLFELWICAISEDNIWTFFYCYNCLYFFSNYNSFVHVLFETCIFYIYIFTSPCTYLKSDGERAQFKVLKLCQNAIRSL